MMAFAPLVITVAPLLRRRPVAGWRRVAEAAITLGAIGVATWALTSPIPAVLETTDGLRYAVFPLLIWVALRFGPWAAASGVAVLTSIVMLDVARLHVAPGAAPPSTVAFVIHLYIFVALASLSALVPAAVMEERIAASEARHASELRFRRLAEQIREAFVEARLSPLRIEYVSPNWATLWGRPIDHAYDPAVWINSVHPEDRHLMEASLGMVTGGEDDTLTFRIRKPDATTRWIRGRVYAVKGAEQEVQGATAVLEDVTEQQLAGERTRQVQKMEALGRLAGGVAHDFNNMLTVIDGSAALLDLALPEAHEARPDLAAIRRAAASARSLTARLLAFSRSEPVEARPIALHAVVESASDIVTRLVGRKVTVQRRLEARNDLVLADRQHLEQVLVNLAVNAGDAMPSGGALMIATRAAQVMERSRRDDRHPTRTHYVCLSVQDTGHGMSAETKARAFEPFYTTKAEGKGTGLGLATVFSIAQQYGGFVTIDSTEGVGTTVEVYLPELPSTSAPPADT
ncbi:MAG: PAS domain-containing protein [Gemmatimonadetes bacterium]|nr:PAS domain-containing protein [Gemmatimonadota bacterium]